MSDAEPQQKTHPGLPRLALLVSLGLNLFLAGWWVGDIVRPSLWPPDGPRRGPIEDTLARLHGKLSADGMAKIETLSRGVEEHFRAKRDAPRAFRERLKALLAAERFDAEAFDKAVDDEIAQRAAFETQTVRRISEVLKTVSSADRAVLARTVLDHRPFGPPPGPPPE